MRTLTRNLKLGGLSRTQEASYSRMTEKVEKATQYVPQNPQTAQQRQYLIILEVGIKWGLKKEDWLNVEELDTQSLITCIARRLPFFSFSRDCRCIARGDRRLEVSGHRWGQRWLPQWKPNQLNEMFTYWLWRYPHSSTSLLALKPEQPGFTGKEVERKNLSWGIFQFLTSTYRHTYQLFPNEIV